MDHGHGLIARAEGKVNRLLSFCRTWKTRRVAEVGHAMLHQVARVSSARGHFPTMTSRVGSIATPVEWDDGGTERGTDSASI